MAWEKVGANDAMEVYAPVDAADGLPGSTVGRLTVVHDPRASMVFDLIGKIAPGMAAVGRIGPEIAQVAFEAVNEALRAVAEAGWFVELPPAPENAKGGNGSGGGAAARALPPAPPTQASADSAPAIGHTEV